MTKTAYARRRTSAEIADLCSGLSPSDAEEVRLDAVTSPLFDMFLRFRDVFGDRAIDRLDVTDEDAEAMAKKMEGTDAGASYAYLLRSIADRRRQRLVSHMISSIWAADEAAGREPTGMSMQDVAERYEKLPKGDA